MSDPFAARLAELAPGVDLAASRQLFESLRSEDGSGDQPGDRNPRWLLAAACVLLLVAGTVGVWAVADRDDDRAPATPPGEETSEPTTADSAPPRGDGTEFRLIAVEAVGDFDRRAIHVADTRDELDSLLASYRDSFDRHAAEVAFQQSAEIAVVIERPDNACPLEIERFVPIEFDSTWRVEWADKSDEPCEDIGLGWVYLVAIPRSALTGIDRIVLPAEPDGSGFELGAIVADPAIEPPTDTTPTPAEQDEAALDAATALVFDGGSGTDGGIAIGASNQAQFDIAMMPFPDVAAPPEIDFDTDIAIGFTTMDDGCRAEFRGLNIVRTEDGPLQLMPQLVEPASPDGCTEEGNPRLFVVTIQRGVLPDTFEFFVPPNLAPSSGTGVLSTIDLAAPATYSTVSGAPAPPEPITFAASQAPLDALAASVGAAWSKGSVDFESLVVATFTIAPGECDDDFDGFDVTGRVWTTRFIDADGCLDAEESRWARVLIERGALEGGVELRHADATLSVDPAYSIVAARWSCSETDIPLFGATLDLPASVDVRIEVRDGDDVTGWGMLGNGGDAGTLGLDFGMTGSPSESSVMVVIDLATSREVARMPLGHLLLPNCG